MPFGFFEACSTSRQATLTRYEDDEDDVVPSQAEIQREMVKLKEDSAKDVERQLEQQQSAEKRGEIKEDVEKWWKAAEGEVETIVKDAEVDVKGVGRLGCRERVEGKKGA